MGNLPDSTELYLITYVERHNMICFFFCFLNYPLSIFIKYSRILAINYV